MGSFSIWHWSIVLVIVMLVFGTRRLKDAGADLGSAVKSFRDGLRDGTDAADAHSTAPVALPSQQSAAPRQ